MSKEDVVWVGYEGRVEAVYIGDRKFIFVPKGMENPVLVNKERLEDALYQGCYQECDTDAERIHLVSRRLAYLQHREEEDDASRKT